MQFSPEQTFRNEIHHISNNMKYEIKEINFETNV